MAQQVDDAELARLARDIGPCPTHGHANALCSTGYAAPLERRWRYFLLYLRVSLRRHGDNPQYRRGSRSSLGVP